MMCVVERVSSENEQRESPILPSKTSDEPPLYFFRCVVVLSSKKLVCYRTIPHSVANRLYDTQIQQQILLLLWKQLAALPNVKNKKVCKRNLLDFGRFRRRNIKPRCGRSRNFQSMCIIVVLVAFCICCTYQPMGYSAVVSCHLTWNLSGPSTQLS
jgi:hypothetical protein